jgi:hypothetical protein
MLIRDADPAVRRAATKAGSPEALAAVDLSDPDQGVRRTLAERTIDSAILDVLAHDSFHGVRHAVAKRIDASESTLRYLANDDVSLVRLRARRSLARLNLPTPEP